MTTLMLVDGSRGECRSKAVVRRIREELARQGVSVSEVARRHGLAQQYVSRRMTGATDWKVGELDDFCAAAGISFGYVTTGVRQLPGNDDPSGNDGVVRPKGFEPLTFWSGVRPLTEVRVSEHPPLLTF
ncbi:helix-turn-helix domain-containing protein, partial [Mycobacteroides abscessus]